MQEFRATLAARISPDIDRNVNIERGRYASPGTITGGNSGIGVNCEICHGPTLGKNVMMGPECLLYSTNHKFSPETRRFESYTNTRPIVIKDGAWIGRHAVIMGDVTIDKGAVIGAGSAVTKDVPPYCAATGNPAVVKKKLLDEQELTAEQRE